jgi:AmmeMemoRadiSam system protein B
MKKNKRILITLLVCIVATGLLAGFFMYARRAGKTSRVKKTQTAAIFHYSYFSQPEFFDAAYQAAKPQPYQPEAKAILVNHHLLAANYIAESFNVVATNAPLTVLLISPNHFSAGKADVITSAENWQTPYGILPANRELINRLAESDIADIDESPFEQEHGVSGLVAFIKKSLPNAKIAPLIIKDNLPIKQARKIAQEILSLLPKNTLIVGSFDFSHYLTSRAADFHDIESLVVVENFDFNGINRLDTDSRQGLALFLELLKDSGNQNFHLLENSNSAKLTHQDVLETTSYIDGYFTPLENAIGEVGRGEKRFFGTNANLMQSSGSLTGFTAGAISSSSANTALVLPAIDATPDVVASFNSNSKTRSIEYLERLFFGQDKTIIKVNGDPNLTADRLKRYGVTDMVTADKIVDIGNHQVKILVQANQPKAKQALDAGASAVVQYGAVADTISLYNNKPIISLRGDLLSDSVLKIGGVSLALGLAFEQDQLQLSLLPIAVKNGIAKLLFGKESDKILADMAAASKAGQEIKSQIAQGIIILKH